MAGKSTISITFKLDGDSKGFKDLANSADGFKGVIEATVSESDHLKKSLINWSQGVQAINAITNTVSTLSSAFSSLSDKMKSAQQDNILTTQLTGKTGEEMLRLRNSVKATAEHFGTDFTETMQAVNALAKGFGITTEEAMKLMRDGFVSGANANGDFIDTLREYPRYFKEAGISAEEFIAISTNAATKGVFSDKGVDAIKEGNLRIREMTKATAEALNGIGISAEKVQADLQNGSITTFDVMQMVSAKLNELPANSAAVGAAIADIFGGPGEDAGLEYLKTLSNIQLSMDAVKAATNGTAAQQERQIGIQEKLKNSISGLVDLSAIYANVQPYVDLAAQAGMAAMGIGGLVKTIKAMNIQQAITATRTAAVAVAQKAAAAATSVWAGVQKVLNLVLTANPIGIIVTAIGALVAAVIAAYKHCDGFRQIVDKVWGAIKPLANAIMNGLAKAFEWLVEKCKEAWEWLKNILGLGGKKVEVAVEVSKPAAAPTIDTGPDVSNYSYTPTTAGSTSTPTAPAAAPAAPAVSSGLIGQLEQKISEARDRLREATSEAAIEAINKEIAAYEAELSRYEKLGQEVAEAVETGVENNGPLWKADAATLKDIGGNIDILTGQLQTATVEEAALINQQIAAWNDKADAIRNAGKEAEKTAMSTSEGLLQGWGAIKGIGSSVQGITDALKGNGNAWQSVVGIVDGFIGLYQGLQSVIQIIGAITGVTNMLTAAKQGEAAASTAAATAAVTGAAATATASATAATAKSAETAANVSAAVSGTLAAHSGIPFVGIALGLAAVGAIIAAMASIPKFANGGVVSGPTLAMVGEYAGAGNNPEVIAPLDKLRGMLAEPAGFGGKVEFEIKGRTLRAILAKENKVVKRS